MYRPTFGECFLKKLDHMTATTESSEENWLVKAGQTYLPSGHGGMRVQPAGVYIECIPQSHKMTLHKLIFYSMQPQVPLDRAFAVITAC